MYKLIQFLAMTVASILFVGCDGKEDYTLSKSEAFKINSAYASEMVDSFGAEGPYRWAGSSGFPRGTGGHAWVKVNGQKIKKELPKLGENEWYVLEQFKNEQEDGFVVIYKYSSEER